MNTIILITVLLWKNLPMLIFLLWLEKLNQVTRPLNLKLVLESRLLNIRIFVIDSMLKTNPWTNKIKDLKRDAIIGSFYKKVLLLSRLWISYYPEPASHIKNRFKLVLGLSNYPSEKNETILQVLIYLICC